MRRLFAFLGLLLLALAPAAARSVPAMACCPAQMTAGMEHGGHRQHDTAPGDAADCAMQVAADLDISIRVAEPVTLRAPLPAASRPLTLTGMTHAAEAPPPRQT